VGQASPTVLASGPIVRREAISIELRPTPCLPRFASSGRPQQRSPHPPATTKWPAQPCSYSLKRPHVRQIQASKRL
jgi:hypothetical protein